MIWLKIIPFVLLEIYLIAGYFRAAARWNRDAREHRRFGGTVPRK
jgi:hypothetical protein